MNRLARAVFVLSLAFLVGCQTSQDALKGQEILLSESSSSYGGGSNLVGVVLPASAQEQVGDNTQDYLDGAKLGVDLLGQGNIKLLIQRTDGTVESSAKAAAEISTAGAIIVIGPLEKANVTAVKSSTKTPLIALMENSIPSVNGVYTFLNEPILGVNEAVRATVASGTNSFVVLSSSTISSEKIKRVTNEITRRKAKVSATYQYNTRTNRTYSSIRKNVKAISGADVVIILGSDKEVKAMLDVFVKQKIRPDKINIIEVRNQNYISVADPSYEGVIFAKLPSASLSMISTTYSKKFNRPPTTASAYGFDVMAMIAGLQRSKKLAGKVNDEITNPTGYRALNGYFRFHKDGRIERRHAIHRIKNKQLTLLQEVGEGF